MEIYVQDLVWVYAYLRIHINGVIVFEAFTFFSKWHEFCLCASFAQCRLCANGTSSRPTLSPLAVLLTTHPYILPTYKSFLFVYITANIITFVQIHAYILPTSSSIQYNFSGVSISIYIVRPACKSNPKMSQNITGSTNTFLASFSSLFIFAKLLMHSWNDTKWSRRISNLFNISINHFLIQHTHPSITQP